MISPSISVIIPAFNAVRFLPEAIQSVRDQHYASLDIHVIDDGSTDGTFELAQSMPDVRACRQPNAGAAAARNAGVERASGEFLAFLDADDLWAPGKLQRQLEVLGEEAPPHIVAGRVEEFSSQTGDANAARLRRRSGDRAYTVGALLMRADDFRRVGLFDPALRFGEFMDWRSRAIAAGLRERVLEEVVLYRRLHEANTTRLAKDFKADYVATIRAHLLRRSNTKPDRQDQAGGQTE